MKLRSKIVYMSIISAIVASAYGMSGDSPYYEIKRLHWQNGGRYGGSVDAYIKAHIYDKDKQGNTPLHVAILADDESAAYQMLALGANPSAVGRQGHTPLSLAACRGKLQLIHSLIAAGADLDAVNNRGFSPVRLALMCKQVDAALALLESGANGDAAEKCSNNTLLIELAADSKLYNLSRENRLKLMRALLRNRVSVNEKNSFHESALSIAQEKKDGEMVALLKAAGAKEDGCSQSGRSWVGAAVFMLGSIIMYKVVMGS